MWGFFGGWRRKAGCGVLLLAIAGWGLWVRSLLLADLVIMNQMSIIWCSTQGRLARLANKTPTEFSFDSWRVTDDLPLNVSNLEWSQSYVGFGAGKLFIQAEVTTKYPDGKVETMQIQTGNFYNVVAVPYWSIVLPLTLFAGALILPTPKNSKAIGSNNSTVENA